MIQSLPLASVGFPVADAAALGTAVGWAGTALFFTAGGRRVGSLPVNVIRLAMGLAMMTVFRAVVFGKPFPVDATQHAWGWLSASGVVGMAICDLCLFEAFLWVGPRVGMLLLTLAPLVAAALGWVFLGEDLTWVNIGGMALVLAGVGWVVLERQQGPDGRSRSHPVGGVLLGAVAAVGQGVGSVLSRIGMRTVEDGQVVSQASWSEATQIREIAGLVAIVVFYCFLRVWPKVFRAMRDRRAMVYTSCGAFFGPFVGVALSMIAIKQADRLGIASTLMMTGPVFIIPLAAIFQKERIGLRAISGALLAVAGVFVLMLRPGHPLYDWLTNGGQP